MRKDIEAKSGNGCGARREAVEVESCMSEGGVAADLRHKYCVNAFPNVLLIAAQDGS